MLWYLLNCAGIASTSAADTAAATTASITAAIAAASCRYIYRLLEKQVNSYC